MTSTAVAKQAVSGFSFRFVKEEIEFTGTGVGVDLLVPRRLFAEAKPLDDAPVVFRGRDGDRRQDRRRY